MDPKIKKCDDFANRLTGWRVSHERPNPYQIQIQIEHNFYLSTGKYYNSATSKRFIYPNFKSVDQLFKFLSENVSHTVKIPKLNVDEIIEILNECDSIEHAIKSFKKLKPCEDFPI
jgi:hypothetical protein